MSAPAHPPVEVASQLPEDSVVCGIPLSVIRHLATARQRVKNGVVKIHVVHGRDDRISIEDSVILPRAS